MKEVRDHSALPQRRRKVRSQHHVQVDPMPAVEEGGTGFLQREEIVGGRRGVQECREVEGGGRAPLRRKKQEEGGAELRAVGMQRREDEPL